MSVPVDPNAVRSIRVQNTALVNQVLPALNVGDVLRFTVRSNNPDGDGLIYYRGQLIQAKLPRNAKSGDRLTAQIAEVDDQVVLQVIDSAKGTSGAASAAATSRLAQQLATFLRNAQGGRAQGLPALLVPDVLKDLAPDLLRSLFTNVAHADALSDPKAALSFLLSSAQGNLADPLRDSASTLKTLLNDSGFNDLQRVLTALREQLSEMLGRSANDNTFVAQNLSRVIHALGEQTQSTSPTIARERDLLRDILRDLQRAQSNPENIQSQLEAVAKKIDQSGIPLLTAQQTLDPQLGTKLTQLITRLEQMAAAQETLNQLNPLMQALGEPAMILFPFLFSGLISHSEVSIDPDARRRGGRKRKKNGKEGSDEGDSGEPYQRIQVTVPLPSMGPIAVDIAHRDKELLARFTVEDQELCTFLNAQLERLAALLREQGYEKAELMTSVNSPQDESHPWDSSDVPKTTVVV